MKNNTLMYQKIEYQYHTTAKQLYHVALYAVGDAVLAEQAAAGAFSDAFERFADKSDINLFEKQCYRLLYRYGKNIRRKPEYKVCRQSDDFSESLKCVSDHKHLSDMLISLDFEERYIVLLFCLQKYSVRQISGITRLPCFLIEKRLVAAVGKTMR